MKVLVLVLTVFLVVGCGSLTPLHELEEQALLTGDWSEVERRERIQARRKARQGVACPAGHTAICEVAMGEQRCTCVEADTLLSILAGR